MLRTPPFARAPLLLLRHRIVFTALAGAGLILGLVVALTPQFLSSASSAALERELSGRCDSSYAASTKLPTFGRGAFRFLAVNEANRRTLTDLVSGEPNLLPPRSTILSGPMGFSILGEPDADATFILANRTGFETQIELIEGGEGAGAWIDVYAADLYGLEVGDVIEFSHSIPIFDANGEVVGEEIIEGSFPIAAITEDQSTVRTLDFWCGLESVLAPTAFGDRQTPLALVDIEAFGVDSKEETSNAHFLRHEEFWELPVATEGLTLSQARDISSKFERFGLTVMSDADGFRSDIGPVTERVAALGSALETSVRPLSIAVAIVALALMAGAGSYWVDRRTAEIRFLNASGVGPIALGGKAVLESFLPVVTGVAAGALVSVPIAGWVGPGGAVESSSTEDGWLLAIPTAGIALLLIAIVAGWRSGRILAPIRPGGWARWWTVPAAATLIVLAVVVRRRIGDSAVVFGESELVGSVDPLVILFPMLIFLATVLILADFVRWIVPRLSFGPESPNGVFLATRRIASGPGPVMVLILGALLPVATLAYSAALTRSSDVSVQIKGRVFIGSDVRAPVYEFDPIPAELDGVSTYVARADRVEFDGVEVDLLIVDPDTFEAGAFWHDDFADASLEDLLSRIADADDLVAISANAPLGPAEGSLDLGRFAIPLTIVEAVDSFPGSRVDRPILIVARDQYRRLLEELQLDPERDGATKQIWVQNRTATEVEDALGEAGVGYSFTTSVDEALDQTKFQVIIWTFDFLELYASLAGIIVVGALILYADTRQRSRNLSYALAIRMGLTRREHLRAGLFEMGGLILIGTVFGSLAAHFSARSVYAALDALPQTPPGPTWVGVLDLVAILLALGFAVALLVAFTSQRTADNADVSELLRHQ